MKLLMVTRGLPPAISVSAHRAFWALYGRARTEEEVYLVAGYHEERAQVPDDALAVRLRGRTRVGEVLAMRRAVQHAMTRLSPDVLLSNTLAAPMRGGRTVWMAPDLVSDDVRPGAQQALSSWRARKTARVLAPSAVVKATLVRTGVDPGQVVVVNPGLSWPPAAARDPMSEGVRVVVPGAILPRGGAHLVVDALCRLGRRYQQQIRLDLVGERFNRRYLEQIQVASRGLSVHLHPEIEKVGPFLDEADLVVVPSLVNDGFSMPLAMAMARGIPVVWSEDPGRRETTGGHGVAVPRGEVDALMAILTRAVDGQPALAALGREGRIFAERYSWDHVWPSLLATLQEI